MTTMLLNIHNTGFFPMASSILAMGIFYGGIAQIIAGILEYKKATLSARPLSSPTVLSGLPWSSSFSPNSPRDHSRLSRMVPFSLGRLHVLHVVRYLPQQPGAPVRLPEPHRALLDARHPRLVRRGDGGPRSRLGGHRMRVRALYLAMAEVINESRGRTVLPIGPYKA